MTMTENKNIQNTQANLDLQGDSWVDREFLIQIGQLRKRLNSNILPQFPLEYKMYDLLEDHTNSEYFEENKGVNVLSPMVA